MSKLIVRLTPPPVVRYCNQRVCVSVREHISGTIRSIFAKFFGTLLQCIHVTPVLQAAMSSLLGGR